MTALVLTLVIIANVLGSLMAYPQAAKLLRTGDARGVSGVWAGVSIAMNAWWLGYGLANELWGLVPTSAIASLLYVVIAVALVRSIGRQVLPSIGIGLAGAVLAPLPALVLGGWAAAGVTIGVCYGLQLAPAVLAVWRTSDLAGVARGTWLMAWSEAAIWGVYGVVVIDEALLMGGASGILMASLILARLVATGHRPFRIERRRFAAI